MNTETKSHNQPTQGTSRLATTSLVMGILALLPFTYAWFFAWMTWASPMSTWYFGWGLVIGFHVPVFVGILVGLSSLIAGKMAGKSVPQRRRAKFGAFFGIAATVLAILYLGYFYVLGGSIVTEWLVEPFRAFAPPPDHTHVVESVAFSPDGTLIASAGSEGTVKLWEVSSGRQVYTIVADSVDPPESSSSTNDFTSVAFSPDGSLLAGGSSDGTARLWEAQTGLELHRLHTGSQGVECVAFSPDGRLLAAGAMFPHTVTLWDTTDGGLLRTLTGSGGRIDSVAFAPDGELLAGSSQILELWEVATGRLVRTLEGFDYDGGFPSSTTFSPDGQYIAAGGGTFGSNAHAILIWDLQTGMAVQDMLGRWIYDLAYSPSGSILAIARSTGVQLWDVAAARELAILPGGGDVNTLAFSPDGTLLVIGTFQGDVRVLNVPDHP